MKYLKYIAVVFALAMFGAGYAYANVVRLALINYSGFHNLGSNIYLSQSLPDSAKNEIPSLLEKARDRIASQYGETLASPVIVVIRNDAEQGNYGLYDSPGALFNAPWQNYLVLNCDTADINVVAHELVHAEVVHRVGYIKYLFSIPAWFDEGAAMQVDHRPKYAYDDAMDLSEFNRIVGVDTPKKFWTSDKNQNIDNYRFSKMAVAEIFNATDNELYSMLEKIRQGEGGTIATAVNETKKALQGASR